MPKHKWRRGELHGGTRRFWDCEACTSTVSMPVPPDHAPSAADCPGVPTTAEPRKPTPPTPQETEAAARLLVLEVFGTTLPAALEQFRAFLERAVSSLERIAGRDYEPTDSGMLGALWECDGCGRRWTIADGGTACPMRCPTGKGVRCVAPFQLFVPPVDAEPG